MAGYQPTTELAKKMQRVLVHQLALGPATETKLFEYKDPAFSCNDFIGLFNEVAMWRNDKWKLTLLSFKQLDVYSYRGYTTRKREAAVRNAIRAYDKMKLVRSDPAWLRLLPPRDRRSGIWLSKRQARAPVATPAAATPTAATPNPVELNERSSINGESNVQNGPILVSRRRSMPATKSARNGSSNSSDSDLSSLSREILELGTKRV